MIEIEHRITIEKKRGDLWAFFANVNYWGRWSRVIKHAALYGPLRPGVSFKLISGKWDFDGTIIAVEPPNSIEFSAKSIGITVGMKWVFSDSGNSVEVLTATHIDGWFTKMFRAKIMDAFEDSVRIWLNALKLAVEQGTVLPEQTSDDDSEDDDPRTVQFTDPFSLLFRRKKSD